MSSIIKIRAKVWTQALVKVPGKKACWGCGGKL